MEYNKLYTAQGRELTAKPWDCYPRPCLRRDRWLNLNGSWDFAVTMEDRLPKSYDRKILVPFAPESILSGIGEHFGEDHRLCYRRCFTLPTDFAHERILLHFGAVDQTARVYLNGREVGYHEGGYMPFTLEITDFLQEGENMLELLVTDDLRKQYFP